MLLASLQCRMGKKLLKRNLDNRNIHTSQHSVNGVVKVNLSIKLEMEFGQNINCPHFCLLPVADEFSMAPDSGMKKTCM